MECGEILVRQISGGDADALDKFFSSLGPTAKELFNPHPMTREFAERLAADAGRKNRLRLIATKTEDVGERVIGYAFLSLTPLAGRTGYFGIAVSDKYAGQGVAKALVNELLAEARALGVRRVVLTVRADNQPALGLYRKFGFGEDDRIESVLRILTVNDSIYAYGIGGLIRRKVGASSAATQKPAIPDISMSLTL